ncbi:MAG: hypothetical protein GY722_18910 [bacterium]|nr:hypothetical protein [bacterium]
MNERLNDIRFGIPCMATGSAVYGQPGCDPIDRDWITLGGPVVCAVLEHEGWTRSGNASLGEEALFRSYYKHDKDGKQDNIIVALDKLFLVNWIAAHDECVGNPPKDKAGRIEVFRRHLYGSA